MHFIATSPPGEKCGLPQPPDVKQHLTDPAPAFKEFAGLPIPAKLFPALALNKVEC
jgi:hypothetical protein